MGEDIYDLVIIGSGPAGYVAALRAAQLGVSVCLVEGRDLGGTCLNRGCIPTKALVRSAEVYRTALSAEDFGIAAVEVGFRWERVLERKKHVVERLVGGIRKLLSSAGVRLLEGRAFVDESGRVSVRLPDSSVLPLKWKKLIIATGSTHALPPVPPEDLEFSIDSDRALALERPPRKAIIIGGGVVGVEFGCIFNAFGANIDIVKRTPLLLPPVDEEISRRIAPILKKRGVRVNHGFYIKRIRRTEDGLVRVIGEAGGEERYFEGEIALVAMGRRPDFGGLDLDRLGVRYNDRGIAVDEYMRTTAHDIYAAGDVVGRYFLAPVASAEGVAAAENAVSEIRGAEATKQMDYSVIPQCVFSVPEAASVGLTERQAREKGISVKISRFPFSANGKAVASGEDEGIVKVVSGEDGRILGVHILGPHATELIHEGALAVQLGASTRNVSTMIHAHPTLSEALMEAMAAATGESVHLVRV